MLFHAKHGKTQKKKKKRKHSTWNHSVQNEPLALPLTNMSEFKNQKLPFDLIDKSLNKENNIHNKFIHRNVLFVLQSSCCFHFTSIEFKF